MHNNVDDANWLELWRTFVTTTQQVNVLSVSTVPEYNNLMQILVILFMVNYLPHHLK